MDGMLDDLEHAVQAAQAEPSRAAADSVAAALIRLLKVGCYGNGHELQVLVIGAKWYSQLAERCCGAHVADRGGEGLHCHPKLHAGTCRHVIRAYLCCTGLHA
mmetsp:Transcript_36703/g.108247  ORF Transcript_36703/g.108247 Transcript_36703/m.108247 type:complete len:103 (+) Transcript_36703:1130-1438(+)|eukprot:349706-Chlamydomonas_euryale.AAC.3